MRWKPLLRYVVILITLALQQCHGQEKPTLSLEIFDESTSYRQSVCERQAQLDNNTIALRDALAGLELTTLMLVDNRYFIFDENGAIDQDDPGLIGVLLDELADRARFTWRNSFGIIDNITIPEDKTYTELLSWSVWAYDISAAYWTKSLKRMDNGVSFPEGWYDGRIIMVGLTQTEEDSLYIWSFLEPFTAEVWGMIIVTIFVSACVYMFLDWFDTESDADKLGKAPGQNFFLAAITFTGHFEFRPKTNAARIFTASLAFWSLIMMSAYTANLASFLVVQNTPSLEINTVEDAVQNNYRICVLEDSLHDEALQDSFPEARAVYLEYERDTYEALKRGECDIALEAVSSFEEYKRDRTINGDCRLTRLGRNFRYGEGGFALKSDSGTLCTSLVRDVLNLHLVQMKNDGFIGRAWENHLKKRATVDCDTETLPEDDDESNSQLSLTDMGGTFIIHYIATAVSILLAVFWKYYKSGKLCGWNAPEAQVENKGPIISASTACENGLADKSGVPNVTNRQFEVIMEKQSALAEQNAEIMAMIRSMKTEPNSDSVLRIEQSLKKPDPSMSWEATG